MVGEDCVTAGTTHLSKPVCRLRAATALANRQVNAVGSLLYPLTGFIRSFRFRLHLCPKLLCYD